MWCCCIASDQILCSHSLQCGKEIVYFSVELCCICDAIPLMVSGINCAEMKGAFSWPHLCENDVDIFFFFSFSRDALGNELLSMSHFYLHARCDRMCGVLINFNQTNACECVRVASTTQSIFPVGKENKS